MLAGGMGTRLRDRVPGIPKPMAPVAGRPFLEYVLHGLSDTGVSRVVLSVGYLGEVIVDHFGTSYGDLAIDYCEEPAPLGTGGAIKKALPQLGAAPFLVLNGDTCVPVDVAALSRAQATGRPGLVMTVCEMADVSRYGAVLVRDGRAVGLSEKGLGGPGLINGGVYLVAPALVDVLGALPDVFSFEKDVLAPWVRQHGAAVVRTEGPFIDIGVPADYDRAAVVLASHF